ncbi:hypothetical protein B296_00044610 [Ensete ventricosum]|uniref:Uncharacterized protein n=1 Tax=Ensete ventricosum TaxID=4639 RepID=A0A426YDH2_ENSVE|nr:hypothetical protein B296_00044610 [Ensete ventricosum]
MFSLELLKWDSYLKRYLKRGLSHFWSRSTIKPVNRRKSLSRGVEVFLKMMISWQSIKGGGGGDVCIIGVVIHRMLCFA